MAVFIVKMLSPGSLQAGWWGQKDDPHLLPTLVTTCLASFLDSGRNLNLKTVVVGPGQRAPW